MSAGEEENTYDNRNTKTKHSGSTDMGRTFPNPQFLNKNKKINTSKKNQRNWTMAEQLAMNREIKAHTEEFSKYLKKPGDPDAEIYIGRRYWDRKKKVSFQDLLGLLSK